MRVAVTLLLVLLAAGPAGARTVSDAEVDAVARQLRCVVCQNLSVADSPSEMARQMRDLVRERLAAGESPEAVIAYFVDRYGEWVLLAPPARGFGLLAWALPLGGFGLGLAVALVLLVRWSRRPAGDAGAGQGDFDPEDLAAVREALRTKE